MANIFDLAKKTPMTPTLIRVPFPFKFAESGYEVVEREKRPVLDKDGEPILLDDGQPYTRPAFKEDDVELWLIVSTIPAAQLEQARKNVRIDCDKLGVPVSVMVGDKERESATATDLLAAERARLVLEHVTDWEHCPKDGNPLPFDREALNTLFFSVGVVVTAQVAGQLLYGSYISAQIDEVTRSTKARAEGRPTSGKASESLAFAG